MMDEPSWRAALWKRIHSLGMAWCGWAFHHLQNARARAEHTE